MRSLITGLLGGTLLLTACAPAGLEPVTVKRATRSAPTPKPAAIAAAELAPEPEPTPTPEPTPQVPSVTLSGLVRLDASYVVSAGGGNLIGGAGANVVSAGGGNVISAGGGNVVSAGGGNLIGGAGGNLIGGAGANFRLIEAASVAVGTVLPVQGMMVVPVSLTTGKPLGEPVLTDEKGAYTVRVPQSVTENVLIFAAVPATNESDPRLHDPRLRYARVVPAQARQVEPVDEDAALMTKYILTVFTGRFFDLISKQPDAVAAYLDDLVDSPVLGDLDASAGLRSLIKGSLQNIYDQAAAAGVPGRPLKERKQIAQRAADALLANVDLNAIMVDPRYYDLSFYGEYPDWETRWAPTASLIDTNKPAVTYMAEIFGFISDRVTTRMKAAGGTFPDPGYFEVINGIRAGGDPLELFPAKPTYTIERPSDFGDFITREYLTPEVSHPELPGLTDALRSVDAEVMPSGMLTRGLLRAIQLSFLVQLQSTLFTRAEARAAIDKALAP